MASARVKHCATWSMPRNSPGTARRGARSTSGDATILPPGRLTHMSSLEIAFRSLRLRRSLAAAALALLAAGATGCVHAYDAPAPSEPHASLRIRRVYENARGTYLRETVKLEERVALTAIDPLGTVQAPRVDGLLARLAPAELEVAAETFHRELQTSNQYVTEEIPYRETETYPCGTEAAPGTCSRTVMEAPEGDAPPRGAAHGGGEGRRVRGAPVDRAACEWQLSRRVRLPGKRNLPGDVLGGGGRRRARHTRGSSVPGAGSRGRRARALAAR